MKLKITIVAMLFCVVGIQAQKEYAHKGLYTSIGYEYGLLFSDITTATVSSKSSIDSNFNHSVSITGLYKTAFNTEIKLGYTGSYSTLNILGRNSDKTFLVTNNYYTHTVFVGAGYNFSIKKDLDITLGLGSAVTYVKNSDILKEYGEASDKILATNTSLNQGNVYLIPELSITKFFNNGNTLTLGGKYYHSVHDNFLQGDITNIRNGAILEQVSFSTQNNQVAIYIAYGINLTKLF